MLITKNGLVFDNGPAECGAHGTVGKGRVGRDGMKWIYGEWGRIEAAPRRTVCDQNFEVMSQRLDSFEKATGRNRARRFGMEGEGVEEDVPTWISEIGGEMSKNDAPES